MYLRTRSRPNIRFQRDASAARAAGRRWCAQRDGAYNQAVVVHESSGRIERGGGTGGEEEGGVYSCSSRRVDGRGGV